MSVYWCRETPEVIKNCHSSAGSWVGTPTRGPLESGRVVGPEVTRDTLSDCLRFGGGDLYLDDGSL